MRDLHDYRPANLEFDFPNNTIVPDDLGTFETAKEVALFVHDNMTAVCKQLTVLRLMDHVEKQELRKEYQDLLEQKLPMQQKDLQKATNEYEEAKKKLSEAKTSVSATMTEIQLLGVQVKRGEKEMTLDEQFTYQVPFENQYMYFSYLDKRLRLVKIKDIPEQEKQDIWAKMSVNDAFFNDNFGTDEPA